MVNNLTKYRGPKVHFYNNHVKLVLMIMITIRVSLAIWDGLVWLKKSNICFLQLVGKNSAIVMLI